MDQLRKQRSQRETEEQARKLKKDAKYAHRAPRRAPRIVDNTALPPSPPPLRAARKPQLAADETDDLSFLFKSRHKHLGRESRRTKGSSGKKINET